ncbi:hypothetical protein BC829DRAFT_443564 [Chytridium lagenaria]|nr:hypothetical protein BC829DRAFT_443564 [Chytridium lagenaria]
MPEPPMYLLSQGRRDISDFADDAYPSLLIRPNHLMLGLELRRNLRADNTKSKTGAILPQNEMYGDDVIESTDLDDLEDVPGKEQPLEKFTEESCTTGSSVRSSSPPKDSDASDPRESETSSRKAQEDITWDEAAISSDKIIPVLAEIEPPLRRFLSTAANAGDQHSTSFLLDDRNEGTPEPLFMNLDDLGESIILDAVRMEDSVVEINDDSERNSVTSVASSHASSVGENGGWKSPNDGEETPTIAKRTIGAKFVTSLLGVPEGGQGASVTVETDTTAGPSVARTSADSGSMNLMSNSSTLTTGAAFEFKSEVEGLPEPLSSPPAEYSDVGAFGPSSPPSPKRSIWEEFFLRGEDHH